MMPNVGMNFGMYAPMGMHFMPPMGGNLFGRIANGIRSFNWGSLLNGANKTLNVMNQTIPLIKQARPMFNNVRSMIRLARAFGSETSSNKVAKNNSKYIPKNNSDNFIQKKEVTNSGYPNFFI